MSGVNLSDVHIAIKFIGEDAQPVLTRYWASWPLGKKQTVTIPRSKVKNVQEIDVSGTAEQGVFDSAWNTK